MIKNIVFDIGSVLVEFIPEKVLQDMELPEDEVQTIAQYTAYSKYWSELDRGVIDKNEVIEKMLSELPSEYRKDAKLFFEKELLKTAKTFDYAKNWLKELKESGYNIYLLTNYPDWMFDYHWENEFTFAPYIDGKVVSGKVKVLKPNPEIYNALLEKYKLNAKECLFIDDRAENIEAAKKLGFTGFVFTDFQKAKKLLSEMLR